MALATWQGPFPADVYGPNGKTRLEIGDTYEVGETELLSAHWKRVGKSKGKSKEHEPEHEQAQEPEAEPANDDAPDGGTD